MALCPAASGLRRVLQQAAPPRSREKANSARYKVDDPPRRRRFIWTSGLCKRRFFTGRRLGKWSESGSTWPTLRALRSANDIEEESRFRGCNKWGFVVRVEEKQAVRDHPHQLRSAKTSMMMMMARVAAAADDSSGLRYRSSSERESTRDDEFAIDFTVCAPYDSGS